MRFTLLHAIFAYASSVLGLLVIYALSKVFLRSRTGALFKSLYVILTLRMFFPFSIFQLFSLNGSAPVFSQAASYLARYNLPASIHDSSRVTAIIPTKLIFVAVLLLAWLSISTLITLRDMRKYGNHILAYRKARHTSDEQINRVAREAAAITRVRQNVRIVCGKDILTPSYSGLIRPTIYLPKRERTDEELLNTLQHEYTHIAHKDAWVKMFVLISKNLLFINPLVPVVFPSLDQACEHHCEHKMSRTFTDKKSRILSYGNTLVKAMEATLLESKRPAHFSSLLIGHTGGKRKKEKQKRLILHRLNTMAEDAEKTRFPIHIVAAIAVFMLSFVSIAIAPIEIANASDGGLLLQEEVVEGREGAVCLLDCKDGTYHLYVDGEFTMPVEFESGKPDSGFLVFDTVEEIQNYVMEVKNAAN